MYFSHSPWGTTHCSRWIPKWGHDPVRSPCWTKFVGKTCDPMGDPHWSSLFLKHHTEATLCWSSGVWGVLLLPWGERSSRDMWWSDCSPPSLFHRTTVGMEVEKWGVKSRNNRWMQERYSEIWFYFSLSCSDLVGNKFISQSQICFDAGNLWVIPPCPYLHPWDVHYIFFPPAQLRRWMMEWLGEQQAICWVSPVSVCTNTWRGGKKKINGFSSEVSSKWRRHNGNKTKYQKIHLK